MRAQTIVLVKSGESVGLNGKEVIANGTGSELVTVCNIPPGGQDRALSESGTAYGFMVEGGEIITPSGIFYLKAGMYFCSPCPIKIKGQAVVICTYGNYRGLFQVGGPIEQRGRLRYIDGCTDTLLVAPPRKGDPCLNHLHFPPNIRQTMHTHPSVRCGVVARGRGRAIMPGGQELPLEPGCVWLLRPEVEHCFYTDSESMDVIAFHPDSDCGPEDDDHPMVNRTLVDTPTGRQRANEIAEIRTKDAALL
jgi:hypothetical protein